MTVKGIDVSKWQKEMSWLTAREAGALFAIIRAGSIDNATGQCYEDSQFQRNALLAPEVMTTGHYWYFRPNHDAHMQADFFTNLIKSKKWKIYPACDVEEGGGKSPIYVANAVLAFCLRVYKNLGIKPMIYTSIGKWNALAAPNPAIAQFYLWVAHWGVKKPTLPREWTTYKFWQTHVGNDGYIYGAQSETIDHDVYNGDWQQFAAEFLGGVTTVPINTFVTDHLYPWMVEKGYTGPKPEKAK